MGTHGMVAAEHPLEAMAGMKVLEAGGNAIDAAVAVFYMTTVVEQHQAGLGGDGFILAYIAKEDRVIFINGTGPAPARATREFYGKLGEIPDAGPYSTDVPGAVGGFDLALSRYGTMPYDELLAPAIEAAKGHRWTFGPRATTKRRSRRFLRTRWSGSIRRRAFVMEASARRRAITFSDGSPPFL